MFKNVLLAVSALSLISTSACSSTNSQKQAAAPGPLKLGPAQFAEADRHSASEAPKDIAKREKILLAYISPSRGEAWTVHEAEAEVREKVSSSIRVNLVTSEALSLRATSFTATEGDLRYFLHAQCVPGWYGCKDDCVDTGNGVYRHATLVNSSACLYATDGRCWDSLKPICRLQFFNDAACTDEIVGTETAELGWVCP